MNENYKHMFDKGILRDMMIEFLSVNYEEAADFSEESMIAEYIYLKDNDMLHLIFEAVQMSNRFKCYGGKNLG